MLYICICIWQIPVFRATFLFILELLFFIELLLACATTPLATPGKKSTEVNCSKNIVLEVILKFTIVNYCNTSISYSITIVLLVTIVLLPYT